MPACSMPSRRPRIDAEVESPSQRMHRVRRQQPQPQPRSALRARVRHPGGQRPARAARRPAPVRVAKGDFRGCHYLSPSAATTRLRAELIRDPNVFLMGEEIGIFEGSYKITAGLLTEFGPEAGARHPDRRRGIRRCSDRRRDARSSAGRRDHDDQLLDPCHGPDRQPRREDPHHVRRPVDGCPWSSGRRVAGVSSSPRRTRKISRSGTRTFPA